MTTTAQQAPRPRWTAPQITALKGKHEKIAVVTAYDYPTARLVDEAGAEVILVGDSLGMVVLGYETTLPVTMDDMLHHTRAVARGAARALIVADMPFLSYQVSADEAVRNAGRLLQEGGASAVKIEGARPVLGAVRRMVDVGIPVMGHLGLQPQSVHRIGGYIKQATRPQDADALIADAIALQDAGAFAVVLESIPEDVARSASAALDIPTIGIGAGPHCDGQVLVSYDMLGLFDRFVPSFVKQYANLAETVQAATRSYVEDVRQGRYPQSLSKLSVSDR